MRSLRAFFPLLGFVAGTLAAQQPASADSAPVDNKGLLITPFIAPGYTPEMGGLLTLGALISFRPSPRLKRGSQELVQRSTLTVNGSYSTTQAINANAKLSTYLRGDQLRLFVDFVYKDMPDEYWGVGFEAGQAPESDSTTSYQRSSWVLFPKVLWRLTPAIMVGGALDFNSTTATNVSPGMAADPYYQLFGATNFNSGAGVVFQFDSRDIAANPWKGVYLNAQALFYGTSLGGDNTYQVYDFDYRQFRNLGRPGRTLAWTARTRSTRGDVPWAELSQLGSSTDLRGYRQGRYRDKAMLYAIVEYRHQFTNAKRPGGLSRHGVVGWVGGGSVGEDLGGFDHILPNWGVGYRFEVQPRMSVRMDIGFGKEFYSEGEAFEPAVYFNFTEAF
jgi:surface antigen Omp85-like protein